MRYGVGDLRNRYVDFIFRRESAQPESNRRTRLIVAQPKCAQHVRRLRTRCRTRGAGRDGEIACDRLQQRLSVNGVDAYVEVVRQPWLLCAIQVNAVDALRKASPETIAQRLQT